MRLTESCAPLAQRTFRVLWIGQTISSAGNSVALVGFVFAILRVGGTASAIGYVFGAQAGASLIALLAGGVWADRLPRHLVMLVCDVIRAAIYSCLAILLATGQAHVWELGTGAAIAGLAASFFEPASTALTPETVTADQLQRANGLMNSSTNLAMLGGLGVAGILVAALGPAPALAIDAASFVVSAITLGLMRLEHRQPAESGSFLHDLAAGWREVAIRPWYWLSLIAQGIANGGFCAYYVLGPVIAAHSLGGPSAWGVILAAQTAGAVVGGALAIRLSPARPLVVGNVVVALAMLPLFALAVPMTTWEVAVAAGLGGTGLIFLATLWTSTMQSVIPPGVQSRVDSYDWLISLAVMPAGMALAGPVAIHLGYRPTLVGAALLIGLPCLLLILVPGVRQVRAATDGSIAGPALRDALQNA